MAVFGLTDGLLTSWRPNCETGHVGYTGFYPILFIVPVGAALIVGLLLAYLAPDTPVELADVVAIANQPDPAVPQVSGYASLVKSLLSVG